MQKTLAAISVTDRQQRLVQVQPAVGYGSPADFQYTDSPSRISAELRTEMVRKSIHLLVALVPSLAMVAGVGATLAILGIGTLVYAYAELLRLNGRPVTVISYVTALASRDRDRGGFVMGPVTLGVGAMLALLLYPGPAATLAIYALAFGDGLSSLVGKTFGHVRIPFTGGKTVIGSATCFVSVYLISLAILGSPVRATAIALGATLLEMVPVRDLDNLLLPIGVGLIANTVMFL